ncbi:MAG: type I pullulanase [Erysipelotrichales bacterium]|nr:type I pullulanase [Erysipelotrichales bacterium]
MRKEEMMEAYLDSYERISVYLHEAFYQGRSDAFRLVGPDGNYELLKIEGITRSGKSYAKYTLHAPESVEIGKEYFIVADYALRCPLRFGYIVRTERFDEEFYYDGDDLGAIYHNGILRLALWAPTASEVKVKLTNGDDSSVISMNRHEKGVWRGSLQGNYDGYEYVYLVKVNGGWAETVDPYAKSANANKRKGYILEEDTWNFDSGKATLPPFSSYTDAIVYETSVRDFTKQFSDPAAGRFAGMTKEGLTTSSGKPAGFDYLKNLGVTHVQLMPVMEFTSVDEEHVDAYYNWGYDPGHYFMPEGSYAMNPNDPYSRVREMQEMVRAFHKAGIRVVMDVVYNHMRERVGADFEKIVPNYYFRLSKSGAPSNGSFCGNDMDSTRKMTRKMILDSLKLWTKGYGVDGFRFDLMGILDVETMNEVQKLVHEIDPSAILYGEGWNMPTLLHDEDKAMIANQDKMDRIGHFNDFFRNTVKGGDENWVLGFATGDLSRIADIPACMTGSCLSLYGDHKMFDSPEKTVNYVECHDGPTVWDKMKISNSGSDNASRLARDKMMLGMVLLAEGIPFIHSGEEFCRTKQGVANSYASPDAINRIDWERKDKYENLWKYTRDLIALRKKIAAFRLSDAKEIEKRVRYIVTANGLVIGLYDNPEDGSGYSDIVVLINGSEEEKEYNFAHSYKVLFNEHGAQTNGFEVRTALLTPLSIQVLGR